jgi:hypothetical protein
MKPNKTLQYLQKIFGQTQDDVITLDEAYKAGGVLNHDARVKKMWIIMKLRTFNKYNLVEPINVANNLPEKIKLTESGKIALKRIPGDIDAVFSEKNSNPHANGNITGNVTEANDEVKQIVALLTELKSANPDNKVFYKVTDKVISVE